MPSNRLVTMKKAWLLALICTLLPRGCAPAYGGRQGCGIGNWWPSTGAWWDATVSAVKHPGTWGPVIGAAVIVAGDWDRDISDWAVKEKHVFGSLDRAEKASDRLRSSAHVGMIVTALAVPSDDASWLPAMAKRLAWEHIGVFAATSATDPIKTLTDRERPNGGQGSLPSWHVTRASAYVGMGYRNLDLADLSPAYRRSAQVILATLVAGTAWARVEAGQHYPTDVLAGAALGNFTAVLLHDALLGRSEACRVGLETDINGALILAFQIRF
jgi:hypothetical protein